MSGLTPCLSPGDTDVDRAAVFVDICGSVPPVTHVTVGVMGELAVLGAAVVPRALWYYRHHTIHEPVQQRAPR